MKSRSEEMPAATSAGIKSTGRLDNLEGVGCIMTLDLGTLTGWCVAMGPFAPEPRTWASGCQDFRGTRYEGGGMRFLRFKSWLTQMKNTSRIEAIAFEEVRRHAGTDAAHVYGGFLAILTAWCEHHQIPYIGVPVGTIKKHATGKGNASKDDMIEAAATRGPCCQRTKDDNQADAVCLMNAMLEGAIV
jgi:Holliday junction resolvasome RuvABC endonuclease subunit